MSLADPTKRVSSRVDNYVRYRPGYPPQILTVLEQECALTSAARIADIGSGTGLLSKIFLLHGNPVFGVEPNQQMRAAGERLLRGFGNFCSVDGTAERTHLPDHSVDFVAAAQAAHWFDRDRARREFVRILKPGGWVVLIWNDRKVDSTPLAAAYEQLLLTYGTDYHEVHRIGQQTVLQIEAFFQPEPFCSRSFENHQLFNYESLKGRLLSASYTPQEDDLRFAPMMRELHRIFDINQQDGRVVFDYQTNLYYGRLRN